ncbi:hypothetical protein [Rhizobium rhizosphaerae]|nr:hypothetical protein [Xaviernesmea rhizosphaerae]
MTRLIVKLQGRKLTGWAYEVGGSSHAYEIVLSQDGAAFARCLADMSLSQVEAFVAVDEAMGHGFSCLIDPDRLAPGRSPIIVSIVGTDIRREVAAGGRNAVTLRADLRIDHVDQIGFRGWCWNPAIPDDAPTVSLRATHPGSDAPAYEFTFKADQFRADLLSLGMNNGNVGFALRWPNSLPPVMRKLSRLHVADLTFDLGARYSRLLKGSTFELPGFITSF